MEPLRTFRSIFRLVAFSFLCILPGLKGFSQWSSDPKTNLVISGNSLVNQFPKISATSIGGCYIAWRAYYKGDPSSSFKACYLDSKGNFAWFPELVTIAPPSDQGVYQMAHLSSLKTDYQDNAVVGFNDRRNGNSDVTVTKISPSGQLVWGPQGHTFNRPNTVDQFPELAVNQDNEVFIVFTSQSSGPSTPLINSLVIQKLDSEGNELWKNGGIVISDSIRNLFDPAILPYPDGGCAVAYYAEANISHDVYILQFLLRRFDRWGREVWSQPTILIGGERVGWAPKFSAFMGKNSLVYVAWYGSLSYFLQCIHPDGRKAFGETGLKLCEQYPGDPAPPKIANEDSQGNIYVCWEGRDLVLGQAVSDQGELLWGPYGKVLISDWSSSSGEIITKIHKDTLYVQYFVSSSYLLNYQRIFIGRFNLDGLPLSLPTVINDVSSWKGEICQSDFINNQTVFAWMDGEGISLCEIKVQNYLTSGSIGPSGISDISVKKTYLNYSFDAGSGTFAVPGVHENLRLILINSVGQKVFETGFNSQCIIPSVSKGIYLFYLQNSQSEILLRGKLVL